MWWALMVGTFIVISSANAQPFPKSRPIRHAIYSMALPGAGQLANKKYWKIPIIYGLMGTSIYGWYYHQRKYVHFREAYRLRTDGDPLTIDPYDPAVSNGFPKYSEGTLLDIATYYRRYRDLMIITTGGIYLLNVLDAFVDAHLADFDLQWKAFHNHAWGFSLRYRFSPQRKQ